mgnify:CR=1 FL=1
MTNEKGKLMGMDKIKNEYAQFKDFPIIGKYGDRYVVEGENEYGHNMVSIINLKEAEKAIKEGIAKKGNGWPKEDDVKNP